MTSTTEPKPDSPECAICGRTNPEHATLNHEFSVTGQLIPRVATQPTQLKVVQTGDYLLRAVLLDLGIITGQQLNDMEVKLRAGQPPDTPDRPDTGGDIANRHGKEAIGGLRGLTTASPESSSRSKPSRRTAKSIPEDPRQLSAQHRRSPLGTEQLDEGQGT